MKTLDEKINTLSSAQRVSVEKRASELIAQELTLRDMRTALNLTQEEMAERLQIGQDNVSRLEKREDFKISTLRSYIEPRKIS